MNRIKDIIGDYKSFLNSIFENIDNVDIDVSAFKCDHLGFRTETLDSYEKVKNDLSIFGELLAEPVIRGRKIAIFKLKEPIIHSDREIGILEIFSPRTDKFFKEGLEHAEFVVDTPLREFMNKYPNINFGTEGLDREDNSEVYIEFENCVVKFHSTNIENVLRLQKH